MSKTVNAESHRQSVLSNKLTPAQVNDAVGRLRQSKQVKAGVSDAQLGKLVTDVYKANQSLAKSLDESEWATYIASGKLPEVISLSPRQLEDLRGGLSIVNVGGMIIIINDGPHPFPIQGAQDV